jgi:two-component system sensor histidine kinase CpxA
MSDPSKNNRAFFYGSRLFLKFFFWFWAIASVTTIIVGLYAYYFHIEPEMRQFDRIHFENMQEAAVYMAEAYEKDGAEAAAIFAVKGVDWFFDENLENILKEFAVFPGVISKNRFFSFKKSYFGANPAKEKFHTPNEKDFPDRKPSFIDDKKEFDSFVSVHKDKIVGFAADILKNNDGNIIEVEGFHFQGCAVTSSSGKKYAAIRYLPWKSKKKHWFMLRRIFEALPLLILISAPFCFFLGRYTARPVIEISEASRRFASGDLSTRVETTALHRYDEIGDLAADFNQMAQRLEDLIKGQQKLLGDISHELRSPLARLQIALEILEKKSAEADKTMLKRIDTEIERLNALIGKLLELNRISSGTQTLIKQKTSLNQLLEKICENGRFEASVRHVSIELSASENIIVEADASLVEQAIENILRNAIKYSPENSQVKVRLQACPSQKIASVIISDQGEGIGEKHLEKIFEPFYRCQEARDRKTGGVGLGLAIARQAILAHNGKINLENLDEGGLRAEIIIPL